MSESTGNDALLVAGGVRPPIYYGWWVLLAAALTEMLSIGSTSYSAGLFVLPLQHEFGLSRAAANSTIPISFAGGALLSPLVGYLLDRISIQWVIGLGAVALGLGFTLISVTSSLLIMVLALFVPIAFGAVAIGPLTSSTLASRWFYRHRGRALGFAAVATSAGGIVVVPLLSTAIEHFGWRPALQIEAVFIVLIVIVAAFFIIRSGPADLHLENHPENWGRPVADIPRAEHNSTDDATRVFLPYSEMLMALNFWAIAIALGSIVGINQAIIISLVPYGTGLGFAPVSAAFLISAFSISAAIVKVVSGLLADIMERRTIMLAAALSMVLALAVLLGSSSYAVLFLGCCLAGASLGGILPSSAALVAACFGSPSFGKVMGAMYVVILGASIVSAWFVGAMFDRTGRYDDAFVIFLVLAAISTLAALLVRTPPGKLQPMTG
ncbi:MAG TPA: MFS transporter [Micropepsaceae bacterium]|nr:MFS transporter [Micropepsaceae bacterium]